MTYYNKNTFLNTNISLGENLQFKDINNNLTHAAGDVNYYIRKQFSMI